MITGAAGTVVGSGYSGLYASLVLAERGFTVDLYESSDKINPTGELLNIFDFNNENKIIYTYFKRKVNEFAENNKINIYLNNKFSATNDNMNTYQAIVVATGFNERFLSITGAVLKNVKSIYDVLGKKENLLSYGKITLLAKSELSIKLAMYLYLQNIHVTLIVPSGKLFCDLPNSKATYYAYILSKLNIKIYFGAKVKKINEESVDLIINNKLEQVSVSSVILNTITKSEFPYLAEAKNIDSDLFIYEPEIYPNNKLYYELVKEGYKGELFMVGNALEIGDISNDIHSAFFVANNI